MYYIMRTTHEKNIVMNQLRQNNFQLPKSMAKIITFKQNFFKISEIKKLKLKGGQPWYSG